MFRIANAPCSWGVIEGIDGERGDYIQVINEMQQTGYAGTELGDWGFMPTDPSFLSQELVLGNDPYSDPVRTKHAGRITPDLGMRDDQWQTFTSGANYVARRVMDEAGLRTAFHHHVGTWVETPDETRRLLDMTDPTVLGLCFDTGHWSFAGGDSVQAIHEFAGRIWHVHFKDHEPNVARQSRELGWDGPTSVGHGVFCELGRGDVDFPGVVKALQDIGYEGWIVVEQDVLPGMGTPKESAHRNREYLKSIGL